MKKFTKSKRKSLSALSYFLVIFFESSLERINSKLTQYNVLSQEIGGADLTKVAMEAKSLELTYTALYSTISKTNQLSLVNFLN